MKKGIIAVIMALMAVVGYGQEKVKFAGDFLGDNFMLYKGAILAIDTGSFKDFSHCFYWSLKYLQDRYDSRVAYPSKTSSFTTEKDSLVGRVFRVDSIVCKSGHSWDSPQRSMLEDYPILVLIDTATSQGILYKYDRKYGFKFPFKLKQLKAKASDFCENLEVKTDDFTGEKTISTPLISGSEISPVIYYKTTRKGKVTHSISFHANSSNITYGNYGLSVIFTDGSKWSRPKAKVDVEYNDGQYRYTSYIDINAQDLSIFASKKILKYRLYIYDESLDNSDAELFKVFLNCAKK